MVTSSRLLAPFSLHSLSSLSFTSTHISLASLGWSGGERDGHKGPRGSFFPDQGQDAEHSLCRSKQSSKLTDLLTRHYFFFTGLFRLPLSSLFFSFSPCHPSPSPSPSPSSRLPLLTLLFRCCFGPSDLLLLHRLWPKRVSLVSLAFSYLLLLTLTMERPLVLALTGPPSPPLHWYVWHKLHSPCIDQARRKTLQLLFSFSPPLSSLFSLFSLFLFTDTWPFRSGYAETWWPLIRWHPPNIKIDLKAAILPLFASCASHQLSSLLFSSLLSSCFFLFPPSPSFLSTFLHFSSTHSSQLKWLSLSLSHPFPFFFREPDLILAQLSLYPAELPWRSPVPDSLALILACYSLFFLSLSLSLLFSLFNQAATATATRSEKCILSCSMRALIPFPFSSTAPSWNRLWSDF